MPHQINSPVRGRKAVASPVTAARFYAAIDVLERRTLFANLAVLGVSFTDFYSGQAVTDPSAGQVVNVLAQVGARGFDQGRSVTARVHRVTTGANLTKDVSSNTAWVNGTIFGVSLGRYIVPPGNNNLTVELELLGAGSAATGGQVDSYSFDDSKTVRLIEGDVPASNLVAPVYHSLPGAKFGIYLSFVGSVTYNAGVIGAGATVTEAYDSDGDPAHFSDGEKEAIRQVWAGVAEDWAPFNIDVTTEPPKGGEFSRYVRVNIGGSSTDFMSGSLAGVAEVGRFSRGANADAFVFAKEIGGTVGIASTASHETAHTMGLHHHSTFDATGKKTGEYYIGSGAWAPIMGRGGAVTTWWNGSADASAGETQDDLAILSSPQNGFGYRADDHGDTPATATDLGTLSSSPLTDTGIIGSMTDVDAFKFQSDGGPTEVRVDVAEQPNLHAVLTLLGPDGTRIVRVDDPDSMSASYSGSLPVGEITALVSSTGAYGYIGQYTLTARPSGPRLDTKAVDVNGQAVSVNGPSSPASVDLTLDPQLSITVKNDGDRSLTLQPESLPSWLSAGDAPPVEIPPASSGTITLIPTPVSGGTADGTIQLRTNDPAAPSLAIPVSALLPGLQLDLSTNVTPILPRSTLLAGKVGRAGIDVSSLGSYTANTPAVVELFLLPPGAQSIPSDARPLFAKPLVLRSAVTHLTASFKYPSAMTDGDYHLAARARPTGKGTFDSNPGNDCVISAPITSKAPYTALSGTLLAPRTGQIVANRGGSVTLVLSNSGNVNYAGTFSATLVASADDVLDDANARVGTFNRRISVRSNGTTRITFRVPARALAGAGTPYTFFVVPATSIAAVSSVPIRLV